MPHCSQRQLHLHQGHQSRSDKELVGQRIHQLTEGGHLFPTPREKAIQPIGERCQREDSRPNQLLTNTKKNGAVELGQEHDHEQRYQKNPGQGQAVGQIHPDNREQASWVNPRGSQRLHVTSAAKLCLAGTALSECYNPDVMKAVILAGGFGTRLRPMTLDTPKPIVPIFDRPFLFYQLDSLALQQ